MDSKVLIAIIDSLVNEAISNLKVMEGQQGPRGLKGKDGNDFDIEFYRQSIIDLIKSNTPAFELTDEMREELKGSDGKNGRDGIDFDFDSHIETFTNLIKQTIPPFELTDEMKLDLKGEKGDRGRDGRDGIDGESFDFELHKVHISQIISNYISEITSSLKLKFEDLSEDEIDSLRGPRGQRGKPGKDFSLEESKELIETAVADSVMALAPDLKLKFDDLSEDDKSQLKLKFSDLSDDELQSLRGPRGQRGKQGQPGLSGRDGNDGKDGKDGLSIRGEIGPQGPRGLPGRDGRDGRNGEDAPVITDIEVDQYRNEVSLTFQFDNGTEIKTEPFELPKPENIYNVYSVKSGGDGTAQDITQFEDMQEPTGFINRVDSRIEFNPITREFKIFPVVDSYGIYIAGEKIVISSELSTILPDTSGNYYFYVDSNGSLNYFTTFNLSLLTSVAYCCHIYFDADDNVAVAFNEERHGITMDSATHRNLHLTRGAQIVSGADVGYVLGNGSLATHAEVSLGNVTIADEDIFVTTTNSASPDEYFEQRLNPIAYIPIWYRLGTIWKKTTATTYPLIVGTTRAKYNDLIGGTWQLVEAPSNNKVLVTYVFGTTNFTEPVIGILGQAQYQNVTEAREQASWSSVDFGDLPSPEMKLLYIIYYETSSTYLNSAKSRIVYVEDFRFAYDKPVSSEAINNDHSQLLNLGADDHPQYLTQVRAEESFYTETEVDTLLLGKADVGHTHPEYLTQLQAEALFYTEAEVDTLLLGKADVGHTHPLSDIQQSGAISGQVPTWDGSAWVPETPTITATFEVQENGVTALPTTSVLNFSSDFEISTITTIEEWASLSDVYPSLVDYFTANSDTAIVEVKNPFLLKYRQCDPSVTVGSFVRINSSGIAVNGQANSKANSKIIGMVEEKFGNTICNIRVKGISTAVFSGLDIEEDYWLSPITPGQRTVTKPSTSGQYIISLGQALSDSSFFVDIGTRSQI